MTIEARPVNVAIDANSLVVVLGPPGVAVYWGVVGNAIVYPLQVKTDEFGAAAAKVEPTGVVGDEILVTATYGT